MGCRGLLLASVHLLLLLLHFPDRLVLALDVLLNPSEIRWDFSIILLLNVPRLFRDCFRWAEDVLNSVRNNEIFVTLQAHHRLIGSRDNWRAAIVLLILLLR